MRSDGKSASLTAPNGTAQARMLSDALVAAASGPPQLIEAHGTGTPLGDPTELGGQALAFSDAPLSLQGAKANLSHTEPVAGLLGLLALARAVEQSSAAPNAQLRVLNPRLSPRLRQMGARAAVQSLQIVPIHVAGVSSFGYSGTIAHAVVAGRMVGATAAAAVTCLRRCRCLVRR